MSAPTVRKRRGFYRLIPEGGRFVGRPSRWGNPRKVGRDGMREQVIERYRRSLVAGERRVTVEDVRREPRRLDLYCYCAPEPCHADVLRAVANGGASWAPHSSRTVSRYEVAGVGDQGRFPPRLTWDGSRAIRRDTSVSEWVDWAN